MGGLRRTSARVGPRRRLRPLRARSAARGRRARRRGRPRSGRAPRAHSPRTCRDAYGPSITRAACSSPPRRLLEAVDDAATVRGRTQGAPPSGHRERCGCDNGASCRPCTRGSRGRCQEDAEHAVPQASMTSPSISIFFPSQEWRCSLAWLGDVCRLGTLPPSRASNSTFAPSKPLPAMFEWCE